jgi:hypothetical protein
MVVLVIALRVDCLLYEEKLHRLNIETGLFLDFAFDGAFCTFTELYMSTWHSEFIVPLT